MTDPRRTNDEITAEIKHAGRKGWYAWAALVATSVGIGVLSLVVSLTIGQRQIETERANRAASEKALCALVITMDNAYRASSPVTAAGRDVAEGVAGLRQAYHCDER